MANGRDDIRIAWGWLRHPKTIALIEATDENGPLRLLALWLFAGENRPKGVMRSPVEVEFGAGWKGKKGQFHKALMDCGWLDADGLTLHDWEEEQPWNFNRPERVASARANGKRGGMAKAQRVASETPTESPGGPPTSDSPRLGSARQQGGSRYNAQDVGPKPPVHDPVKAAERAEANRKAEADRAAFLESGCKTRSEWVALKLRQA